jgi:TRAP-type C4-dicarboxylate transport system permease small subunit
MRTVLVILLILIALIAFGPAIIALGSQEVAEAFGCQVDLNRAIPCLIHRKDYGDTFYNLGFSIWYSYLSLQLGGLLFVIWLVPATIAVITALRRRGG